MSVLEGRLATLAACLVSLGCVAAVTVRLVSSPAPTPRRSATVAEQAEVAMEIASREAAWQDETTRNFPQDHWSQRDDFHGREYKRALELANTKGIRVEDVLRAVDDQIHLRRATDPDGFDGRNARAVPCKPRPFYD